MSASHSTICKGCWQQMHVPIPIRGPFSIPFKMLGIKRSQMNPNLYTICETMFTRVKRKKQLTIPATVLFADLRGYTTISHTAEAGEVVAMLHEFYDACASAVWARDGIVNKFIGDAVLAIFNFPIVREDHVRQAVQAALELQRRCLDSNQPLTVNTDGERSPVGIGIGIHTGHASIGEVGTAYKDFTIIGSMVNLASRIQGTAKPGEILVTEEVFAQAGDLCPGAESQLYQVKGVTTPVRAYLLKA